MMMCCNEDPEASQRARVVAEAMTWVGTPFMWEAAVKGVGVDCGRFLAAVFNAAGVKQIDIRKFPRMDSRWFLHRATGEYLNTLKLYATEYEPVLPGCPPQPGDIVVAQMGRDWAHSALVVQWPRIIAAAAGYCVTVWGNIHTSPQYAHRPLKFLDPWGKVDA